MVSHSLLLVGLIALAIISGSRAQSMPTDRPSACNPATCDACTPFTPKPGAPLDLLCGIDDVYFPVPIIISRNDLSAGQELTGQQWACFSCCSFGCGFDDGGSSCAVRNYDYSANGKNEYGCTKCGGDSSKNPAAGSLKTSFQDQSTEVIYTVDTTNYAGCGAPVPAVPPPTPTAVTSPTLSPTPIVPSPDAAVPPAGPVVDPTVPPVVPVVPSPSPSPPVVASPPPPPSPVAVAPAPAPAPVPEEPVPSPEVIIITNTPPASSAVRSVSASLCVAVVALAAAAGMA